MELILSFTALLIPVASGTAFAGWLLKGDAGTSRIEAVFLGGGIGLGLLSHSMFILGVLKVPFSVSSLTPVPLVFGAVFAMLLLRGPKKPAVFLKPVNEPGRVRLAIFSFLLLWVLARCAFVLFECLNRPLFSWDTWGNWSAGAKLFFYGKGLMLDPMDENFFGNGYRAFLGHPLHSPMLQVWVSLWLGRFHEIYSKAWTFLYYAGLLGVFYFSVKRESNRLYAAASLFFLASAPLLTYHGQDAYSDLPLSYYAFAGVACFWRFLNEGNRRFLILSGTMLGTGVLVKNEGALFLSAVTAALIFSSVSGKKGVGADLTSFLVPVVLLAGPWLAFKTAYGLSFGHADANSGFRWLSDPTFGKDAPAGLHWEIFGAAFRELFFKANFNLIFFFWAVTSVIGCRTALGTNLKYLFVILLSVIGAFLFIYLTLEVTAVTNATGVHRNALTFVPVMFFTSVLMAYRVWPRPNPGSR